jgi:hypothetical protein
MTYWSARDKLSSLLSILFVVAFLCFELFLNRDRAPSQPTFELGSTLIGLRH